MTHQVCGVHDQIRRGALAMQLDATLAARGRSIAGDKRITKDVAAIILLAELGVDRSDRDGASESLIESATILDLNSLRLFGDFRGLNYEAVDEVASA